MKKRLLSMLLVVVMVVVLLPITVFASEIVESGICGDNLTWVLDDEGILTISGIGEMDNWSGTSSIPWYSLRNNINNVIIEDGATNIGNMAFYKCKNISQIVIPNTVTNIGVRSFFDCTSLRQITLPNSITTIGHDAFSNTAWYDSQSDGLIYLNEWCLGYKGDMPQNTEIVLKEGTRIANRAFNGCKNLSSIIIPDSVTSIGENVFYGCTSLNQITIPNSVTSIGENAFYGCTSLNQITIPNSVTSIGENAFFGCTSLSQITIPNSVTSIGENAFYGCTSLNQITIPNSVTDIGRNAFNNTAWYENQPEGVVYLDGWCLDYNIIMPENTEIILNNGTKYIAKGVFWGYWSNNLNKITIPESVISIGDSAFYDCTSLTDVYYNGSQSSWNSITIGKDNDSLTNATIHFAGTDEIVLPLINETAVVVTKNEESITYTITAPLANINEPCTMLAVIYDGKGTISGIEEVEVNVGDTEKTVIVSADNADNIKLFLWNDLQNMSPLCNSVTKTVNQ